MTVLAAIAMAENDFIVDKVWKDLKWIRPPTFEDDFRDVESFFKEKPTDDDQREELSHEQEIYGEDIHFVDGEGEFHMNADGDNYMHGKGHDYHEDTHVEERDDQPHGYHISVRRDHDHDYYDDSEDDDDDYWGDGYEH